MKGYKILAETLKDQQNTDNVQPLKELLSKGNQLGTSNLEVLSELLQSSSLTYLNLARVCKEANTITTAFGQILRDAIPKIQTIQKLKLQRNQLRTHGL